MVHGRKITLFLVEGEPSGIIKGQIGNWVGLVTQAPRTKLKDLATDSDVKKPGIYALTGPDTEEIGGTLVYIGESENVFNRLKYHERDEKKNFFEEIAVITSTDENMTKGHIRYLESRLIQIATETGRARIMNNTGPDLPPLPPADRGEMEVFLEHLQILLPILGLNFALPVPSRTEPEPDAGPTQQIESPIFSITTSKRGSDIEITARAQEIGGEFVVLEGSEAFLRIDSPSYNALKQLHIRSGKLVEQNGRYVFTRDIPFNSVSAAAAVIRGKNTNGRTAWKLPSGITYGDWNDAGIEAKDHTGNE